MSFPLNVIVASASARRSAARVKGTLKDTRPDELAALVLQAAP